MKLMDYLKNLLQNDDKSSSNKPEDRPDDYCPNCWGRYEYEGKIIKDMEDAHINLNNIEEKKGWIQAYAAEQLKGIKLENKNIVKECPDCKEEFSEDANQNPEGGPW